jgi:RNA-directed DNA polymerase
MEPKEGTMAGRSSPESISTRLQRIAELARRSPQMVMTTLAHHIDVAFLHEAYRRTRKDGATGVDGMTAKEYEARLEENLASLLTRLKTGSYRAPPVRRVHIPKGDGSKTRPIGIPTIEDKILQRAVTMVLEAVYEQDFLDCSYGFRPGRSAHQALEALWQGLMSMGGGYVLELDIQSFFDTVDHAQLRGFLDQRVRDGVLRRVVHKWLKAGVMEEGAVRRSEAGTPQGGVISPLLANVYLHEVLDKWFEYQVKPVLHGRAFLIRYADDAVLVFDREDDARRVMAVLPKRFGKYGLTLHPEKTRLVEFRRPRGPKAPKNRNFDLLGFRHYWGLSRKGRWVVKRKTAPSRFTRTLKRIGRWCKDHRHQPIAMQHRTLSRMLRGHDAYFGITGNIRMLAKLRNEVGKRWRKALDRRSHRAGMTWERFSALLGRFPLPPPRVVHSALRYGARP